MRGVGSAVLAVALRRNGMFGTASPLLQRISYVANDVSSINNGYRVYRRRCINELSTRGGEARDLIRATTFSTQRRKVIFAGIVKHFEIFRPDKFPRKSNKTMLSFSEGMGRMDEITYQRGEWPRVKVRSRRSWSHGICIGHCEPRLWNPELGTAESIAFRCREVAWKNMKRALLIRVRGLPRDAWVLERSIRRISRSNFKRALSLRVSVQSTEYPVLFKTNSVPANLCKSDPTRTWSAETAGHPETWFTKRDLPEPGNCCNRSLIRAGDPRDVRRRAAVRGAA